MIEKQKRFGKCVILTGILAACVIMYIYMDAGLEINIGIAKAWLPHLPVTAWSLKGKQYSEIKNKLLRSTWIKLFPNLIHLVEEIEEDSWTITSPNHTMVTFEKREFYTVGSTFKAKITSYGEDGTRKKYGGDFFLATLRRTELKTDGVSREIVDKKNGEYDVNCILPWEGETDFKLTLLHPSESIYQLMKKCSSEEEFGVYMNTEIINSKGEKEYTNCSLGFPDKISEELCDYSKSQTETRKCIKPRSGECGKIFWQQKFYTESATSNTTYFSTNVNYRVPVNGSSTKIKVASSDQKVYFETNTSKVDLNPDVSTGWFENSKWVPLKKDEYFSVKGIPEKCVRDRNFYFFGDSTIRQWYSYFIDSFQVKDYGKDNSVAWSQGRDADSSMLNSHFQYRSHGPPLHNPSPENSRPYISSSLNSVECIKPSYVLITVGYHYANFDPDVFYSRIVGIKEAIRSLMRRCSGVKVFIKGLHYHDENTPVCPTVWLTYRSEVLLRQVFANLQDIVYLVYWDYSVADENKLIHPKTGQRFFVAMKNSFLRHIC